MDQKEVIEKSKLLQKATGADESPEAIIQILNDLKSGVKASEELLRSTKIGVAVNRSKQSKHPGVARLASEIVKKWRDDVKAKGSSPAGKKSPNGTASPVPNHTSNGTPKPKLTVAPAERDWKKDKVDTARTNQAQRDGCIGLIYNGLAFMSTAPPSEILQKAVAVEAAGFSKHGPETNAGYSTKMRSLFMNLKSKTNPELRVKVLQGEIAPDRFVTMSADELKSDSMRKEIEQMQNQNFKDSQMPAAERSISSSLECSNPKCKGRKTVAYSQAQTRSADEPMTTFCECQSCGKRWKFS
ncbi:transcription elongation factor TFIIS [Lecanora helva]